MLFVCIFYFILLFVISIGDKDLEFLLFLLETRLNDTEYLPLLSDKELKEDGFELFYFKMLFS